MSVEGSAYVIAFDALSGMLQQAQKRIEEKNPFRILICFVIVATGTLTTTPIE